MTEAEWLTSVDPMAMLRFLRSSGKLSARKARLFAVACSRRIWPLIDPLGRVAVETAERFADGLANAEELRAARLACKGAGQEASWYAALSDPMIAARNAALSAQSGAVDAQVEAAAQAELLREIFGGPEGDPCVGARWRNKEITDMAREIYETRSFDKMRLLAESLARAGCTDSHVLEHCRAPKGVHVRGCWLLDLLLVENGPAIIL